MPATSAAARPGASPRSPHTDTAAPPSTSPGSRPASRWGAPAAGEDARRGSPPPPVSRSAPFVPPGTREDAPPPHERSSFADEAGTPVPVRPAAATRSTQPPPPESGSAPGPSTPIAPLPANLNAAEVWASLLKSVGNKPSMGWLEALALNRMDERAVHLSLLPGRRDMQRFVAAPRQREQLAELFRGVLGRPVRVEVDLGAPITGGSSATAVGGGTRQVRGEREEAMSLPLVREVMDTFDVVLIEARSASAPPPAPASALPLVEVSTPPLIAAQSADENRFPGVMDLDSSEPDETGMDD